MQPLVKQDLAPTVPGIRFHRLGAEIDHTLSFEFWEAAVGDVLSIEGSFRWWLGALLNYGESRFGEKYAQAVELTGLSYEALKDYCYVERNVPLSVRTDQLSWTHHKIVAGLTYGEQRRLLRDAVAGGWSIVDLRQQVRLLNAPASLQDAPAGRQRAPGAAARETYATSAYGAHSDAQDAQDAQTVDGEWQVIGDTHIGAEAEWQALAVDGDADYVVAGDFVDSFSLQQRRFVGAARAFLPDLTLYHDGAAVSGYPPFGNVFVDVPLAEQPGAFALLRAGYEREDIGQLLFVSDLPLHEAAPLWSCGAGCLTATGTIFYVGPNLAGFARHFEEYGTVVVGWDLATANQLAPA